MKTRCLALFGLLALVGAGGCASERTTDSTGARTLDDILAQLLFALINIEFDNFKLALINRRTTFVNLEIESSQKTASDQTFVFSVGAGPGGRRGRAVPAAAP